MVVCGQIVFVIIFGYKTEMIFLFVRVLHYIIISVDVVTNISN